MTAKVKRAAAKSDAPVYQLKVDLMGARPRIWRRLQVPGDASLDWLHAVLQTAMGWTNSHLHHFLTREGLYSDVSHTLDMGFGEEPDRDEKQATLMQIAPAEGAAFGYEYDFGDSWEHEVTIEKILPPAPAAAAATALCLDGAGACPPEDCGGIPGYADLLKILKNPKHPEHKEMKSWLGRSIDANAFDREKVNYWLQKLKWPRVTDAQLRKALMARDGYRE